MVEARLGLGTYSFAAQSLRSSPVHTVKEMCENPWRFFFIYFGHLSRLMYSLGTNDCLQPMKSLLDGWQTESTQSWALSNKQRAGEVGYCAHCGMVGKSEEQQLAPPDVLLKGRKRKRLSITTTRAREHGTNLEASFVGSRVALSNQDLCMSTWDRSGQ